MICMSIESPKKRKNKPIAIEIIDYDNLKAVLSNIIVPFTEILRNSIVPDVYTGYEKIPFEKRYPLYQTIMKNEFSDAMRALKTGT